MLGFQPRISFYIAEQHRHYHRNVWLVSSVGDHQIGLVHLRAQRMVVVVETFGEPGQDWHVAHIFHNSVMARRVDALEYVRVFTLME